MGGGGEFCQGPEEVQSKLMTQTNNHILANHNDHLMEKVVERR